MTSNAQVLLLLRLLAVASDNGGGPRWRLGSLTGSVSNRVIEEVDVDAIVRRIDLDALVGRIDLDALVGRIDLDALVGRIDLDALVGRIDVEALVARVDLDGMLARVDVDAVLARVDVDALLARVIVDDLLDRVDVDRLLDRVEVDRLLDRVEVDRLLDRVDVDRLLDRVEVDRLLDRADVDRLLERVDPDAVLARVDMDAVLARVDMDALLGRVDMDALLARVDVDALLADVDVEGLVRRAGIPELIADSTGQAANSALDLARRQFVAVDVAAVRLVQRLLRRDPGELPPGPPLLVANHAGEVQDPRPSRSRTKARVEISGYYAGPISRLLAFAADTVGSTSVFTAVAVASSWLLAVTLGVSFDTTERAGPLWAVALAGWYLLWWWGTVAIAGRTPGMALVGLRIVNRDGAPIGATRALVRVVLLPVGLVFLGIGYAWMLLDRERRALHDLVAGAAVVYDWGGRPAELPTPISRWLERRSGGQPLALAVDEAASPAAPGPTGVA